MQRRRFLALGLASGAALALAGGALAWWRPGWRDGRLTPEGRELFEALAPAILDDLVPADPAARRKALAAHCDRLNASIAGFTLSTQAEIAQLTALLCTPPARLAFTGLRDDWAQADVQDVRAALLRLRDSSVALRQQTFGALRELTNAAWFADPANAAAIGYAGPR